MSNKGYPKLSYLIKSSEQNETQFGPFNLIQADLFEYENDRQHHIFNYQSVFSRLAQVLIYFIPIDEQFREIARNKLGWSETSNGYEWYHMVYWIKKQLIHNWVEYAKSVDYRTSQYRV